MKIIITGANGFIGSSLVEKFFKLGYAVVAIVKNNKENVSLIEGKAKIYYCEICNLDSIYEDLISTDDIIFYHLAWIGVNGPLKADYKSQLENINMACQAAYFAKKINSKRFLIAGTIAENAIFSYENLEHLSPSLFYNTAKYSAYLFINNICKSIGLNFVRMQLSNAFGPNNKTGNLVSYTLKQILNNKKAIFGPANQMYDFIFIDDLLNAICKLGFTAHLNYNFYYIGSGNPQILEKFLFKIGEKAGRNELITIGAREDDGIKYDEKMFSIENLVKDIGIYITKTFDEALEITLKCYLKEEN